MTTKSGIRVESYVQTTDGALLSFDELTPEQKTRCATALKTRWMEELFRGKAVFRAEEERSAAVCT